MPRYQVDTTVIDIPASGAPRTWQTEGGGEPPPPVYRAIVAVGESNTAASDLVSAVTPSSKLTPDARIQLLIPPGDTTFPAQAGTFQTMAIGLNNNTGHEGTDPNWCGWEIGFKPYLDSIGQTAPIYYCQTGQGGSSVTAWNTTTGNALAILRTRVATMKALFTAMGITVQWDILLTLGINDLLDGVITPAALQGALMQLINDVRAEIGVGTAARVSMPALMSTWQINAPAHCAALEELDTLMANVRIIPTADLTGLRDPNHWNWVSCEILGGRMLAA